MFFILIASHVHRLEQTVCHLSLWKILFPTIYNMLLWIRYLSNTSTMKFSQIQVMLPFWPRLYIGLLQKHLYPWPKKKTMTGEFPTETIMLCIFGCDPKVRPWSTWMTRHWQHVAWYEWRGDYNSWQRDHWSAINVQPRALLLESMPELLEFDKGRCVGFLEAGKSIRWTVNKLRRSKATVERWWNRYRREGHVSQRQKVDDRGWRHNHR